MKYAKKLIIIWVMLLMMRMSAKVLEPFIYGKTKFIKQGINQVVDQLERSMESLNY